MPLLQLLWGTRFWPGRDQTSCGSVADASPDGSGSNSRGDTPNSSPAIT